MLTENFLLQSARDHSLTAKQEEVFLLKILQNMPYGQIASQLSISEAACLKRMGEVYEKFSIVGRGRGKEQKLRKQLLEETSAHSNSLNVSARFRVSTPPAVIAEQDSWIQSLHEWFICLGYEFDTQPDEKEATSMQHQPTAFHTHVEWIAEVRARRGWDKIVIHAVHGEVQLAHIRALRSAVHNNAAVEGWVVAPRRISSSAREEVKLPNNDDLFCYTFDELIDQEVDFSQYFAWLEAIIEEKGINHKYVQLSCKKAEFDHNREEAIAYSHYGEQEGWIDGYIDLWLDDPAKEHISVLGEFGTGKTWFTLHYAWQALQKYKQAKRRGVERPRLPLIIPLRDCAKAATIESLVSEYFLRKYQILLPDYRVFEQLNRMGKLLLIFDGFDEMASKVDRQSMINNFWQLARVVVPGSKVILTCRTEHFPDAKEGRELLNAELKASTSGIKAESPQFEVLELEQFSDSQIRQIITERAGEAIAQQFFDHPDLLQIARRPLMLELILDALPAVSSGKPIDLARIYLYAVSSKMEEDILAERTFTSLADKLYFLCELSWEMLSTEQMSISYKQFPDRIRKFFGKAVEADTDLDHWHYDMMGQTLLIRNERGEYSPAHRSFLEFFAAFKLVAELGCLSPDFIILARQQSHINAGKDAKHYQWSEYFSRRTNQRGEVVAIAPLESFEMEKQSNLLKTLGRFPLSKALVDLMLPMIDTTSSKDAVADLLVTQLLAENQTKDSSGYLAGNLITLALRLSSSALEAVDLSHRTVIGADFTGASLRNANFTGAHLENCIFPQGWNGDLSVVYSPDGCFLAVVDSTGEISLRDAFTREPLWQKKGHDDWIRALAFDSKSATLATAGHDQTINFWDAKTGEHIKTISTDSRIYSIIFSHDYDLLASSGDDKNIHLWDTRTGKCLRALEGHEASVDAVVFGRNASREILASGSNDGEIRLWDTNTGECIKIIETNDRSIQTLSFDAKSQTLASGSKDKTIRIWNTNTGACIHHLTGHHDWVRTVGLSFGGRLLASGSNDRTIKIWDTQTGHCLKTIEAHKTRVWSVAFHPDNQTLVSGSDDRSIKFWNVQTGQCEQTLWGNSRGVWSIAFSADAQTVYCGSDDHSIQAWDVSSGENLRALKGHQGRVRTISLSESAGLIASGSDDKTVKLWNMETGKCLKTLKNHHDWVWSVEFSADGRTLASGSLDNSVMLWDTQKKEHIKTLEGHTKFVWSVVWSPVKSLLASGSADQTVRLWAPETGECLQILEGHDGQIASLAFSPDGKQLASISDDGEIRLWDTQTGLCVLTLKEGNQLRTVAWSPDGRYIASAGLDHVIRLRSAESGELLRKITTHAEPLYSLSFSPDGQFLASGGEAGVLRLSEPDNGKCLLKLKVDSDFKGMNVTKATGLSPAQLSRLLSLGAIEKK